MKKFRRGEVESLRSTPQYFWSQLLNAKKNGRKINSPPGLKFGVVTPNAFEVVS
jgi:hypothetical protein